MEHSVTFRSGELTLAGVIHTPEDMKPAGKRPAIMVLHGFGNNKDSANSINPCKLLTKLGYVTFRFDFRGCGKSEGESGMVIPLEQVEDIQAAVTFLESRPEVDATRIGVVGSSFGAAVAIYAGGVDKRIACVISSGGWGHGEQKFRRQHPGKEGWAKFTNMLEEGRRHRALTGKSLMVDRYDIVPIPEHLRANIDGPSSFDFSVETAAAFRAFDPQNDVAKVAPRPLMLIHAAEDLVVPAEGSAELFRKAGKNAELFLLAGVDHVMFGEGETRVVHIVQDWLARYFPA